MHFISILLVLSVLPPVPGQITPDLIPVMENAVPGEKITVIVHMNTEYPYAAVESMHYTEICEVFKNVAENSQKDIVKFIRSLPDDQAKMGGQYWIFNGFHVKATKEVIQELARRNDVWFICNNGTAQIIVEKNSDNYPMVAEWNIQKIQADSCWNAGFNGNGIIVGHLDTGVLTTHAALTGKWLSPYWVDGVNGQSSPYDDHGHGTHTMGTICGGDGFGTFTDDVGVAYGARFIPTKAFNSGGSGSFTTIDTCMNYLANLKAGGIDIRAIGNSWGNNNGSELHWWTIVLNWKTIGVLPVFSNGNAGPGAGTVGAPGSYPLCIGVGSTNSSDAVSGYSSRGPAPNIDPINNPTYWYYPTWNLLKPDVSAPGENVRSSWNNGGYNTISGTSMASPHVTGGTAVLLHKNPGLTIQELYDLFRNYCDQPSGYTYPNYDYGWGRINLWRSLQNVPAGGMPAIPTLVAPFNYARIPVLQPSVSFFSTDSNGDNIRYRVQWDDNIGFVSPDSATTSDYPSGNIVTFTFPSALTNGVTYWWRVKCTDPSGTGYWTQYSSARSFTIGTSLPSNTCSWYQTTNAQFTADSFYQTYVAGDSVVLNGVMDYDTLLSQNFESSGSIPGGWTVVDGNGDGYMWEVGTTSDLGSYTPPSYGVRYAYYSDDDAGDGVQNNNEELISPKIYSGATTSGLEIIYGYGFQVWETGEKYRVKMRRFTGSSWSAWQDLVVYSASGSGVDTVNLGSYLPCDSLQFDWFYSDSSASSHWGYANAVDNIAVRGGALIQFDNGTAKGTAAVFHDLATVYPRTHWGDAVWCKASAADSIGIQVEYGNGSTWQLVPNGVLPGNSTGFFTMAATDTIDLHTLDTVTYNTLRLKALLIRKISEAPTNPALLDFEIGNLNNYTGVAEYKPAGDISGPIFRVCPTIAKSNLKISFAITNPKAGVELKVYDAAGRAVKTFEFKKQNLQLFNEITWNATDDLGRKLPAGIYFLDFKSGDYSTVEKAILLR
ncbi:MAG TPA: S8 family serine peptidase [bacterium]